MRDGLDCQQPYNSATKTCKWGLHCKFDNMPENYKILLCKYVLNSPDHTFTENVKTDWRKMGGVKTKKVTVATPNQNGKRD